MASSREPQHNKTVTGNPAFPNHIATGYPAAAASTTTTNDAYAYSFRQPPTTSYVYRPVGSTSYNYPIRPTLLHRVYFSSIVALKIMALSLLHCYLVFKPRPPELRVDSAFVSRLNLTQSELTATWIFDLVVNNPNHELVINYDRLQASVLYGDGLGLATTQLPPFFQDSNNESTIKFQLAGVLFLENKRAYVAG
ncbi:NDR1/HIN1-like protein 1 [Hevea brasiliensis]|uniref:NDR1/HIN1-like protein 1 n=1 Tax=Hevea brasiliensis TaxID=3981 RepID=UPI0025F2F2C6|nr:NDR1/HIN1-like protein 1 [Hevea brasiliensis]